MEVAASLERLKIPYEYELHAFKWHETIPNAYCGDCGHTTCLADRTYTPDFFLLEHDIIIEVKGIFTVKDRKIAEAMRDQHPDTTMKYLFYYDNKLSRTSKTRYTDWCQKRGLDCGVRNSMDASILRWTDDRS